MSEVHAFGVEKHTQSLNKCGAGSSWCAGGLLVFFASAMLPEQSLKKFSGCSVLLRLRYTFVVCNPVIIILNYADFAFLNI